MREADQDLHKGDHIRAMCPSHITAAENKPQTHLKLCTFLIHREGHYYFLLLIFTQSVVTMVTRFYGN